jgi:signal peptidase I
MLTDASTQTEYYRYDEESRKYYGTVPEGFCIALGDNLINSMDSKSVGLFHNEDILGKAFFRIYPFDVIGALASDVKKVER